MPDNKHSGRGDIPEGVLPSVLGESDVDDELLDHEFTGTQSIDIVSLFTGDVTSSGSFDLRETRFHQLRKLLNALPIPAFLVDHAGAIIFANESTVRMSGPQARFVGAEFTSLFPNTEDGDNFKVIAGRVYQDRRARIREGIVQLGAGRIWGRLHLRALRGGEDRAVLVLVHDLTAEKRQIALQLRHEYQLQKAHDELARRVEERTADLKAMNEKLREEVSMRVRAQRDLERAHNELERRVEERTAKLSEANERLKLEVAERKRAENQLRRSESRLRSLFESATEFIHIVDTNGIVLRTNPYTEKRLGYSERELVGRSMNILLSEESRSAFMQELQTVIAQGNWRWDAELLTKDGEIIVVDCSGSVIVDDTGKVSSVVVFNRDVTDQRRYDTELRAYADRLRNALSTAEQLHAKSEAANRAKSEFLANTSHELRTPLNAIIGFSEVLLDQIFGPLNDKQTRHVTHILGSGKRLLGLIDEVLELAKVESGRLELRYAQVTVGSLIHDSLAMTEELIPRGDRPVAVEVASDLADSHVTVDAARMKKVLVNLLSNAYKFTDGTGRITVSAWEWDGSIAVCVEDDGIGLQSDDIQRIFEAFVQVDSSLSRKQQGAGLGLALSRKLVELHGGRIWAESPGPGQGSAFTFVIPRGGPPEKSREARRVGAGDRLAERPHVMVLEDPSFAGDLISQYLMDVGYRVARCPELHEALAIAKKVKPIAVVVDAMLPARRCLGALEELKQLPETQDALVVAISGSEEDNASACPQVDLRVKPLDLDRLLKALRSVELCSRGEGRSPEVS